MKDKCLHNCLVIGGDGKLGPVWIENLIKTNIKVISTIEPGKMVGDKLQKLHENSNGLLDIYEMDVLSQDKQILGEIVEKNGICKVLYNAGIDIPPNNVKTPNFYDFSVEEFQNTININLIGAFNILQNIAHRLIDVKHGSILLVGSLYATLSPDQRYYEGLTDNRVFHKPPAYGASKAGLINLGKYLATLWGEFNIRVNVISPGGVFGEQDVSFINKFVDRVPLKRLADAELDIAPVIKFLLSDDSQYITGQNIIVDGGYSAW